MSLINQIRWKSTPFTDLLNEARLAKLAVTCFDSFSLSFTPFRLFSFFFAFWYDRAILFHYSIRPCLWLYTIKRLTNRRRTKPCDARKRATYRLEEAYIKLTLGLRKGFTIITPQTWTNFDETSNISVANLSRGSAKQRRKVFCFFVANTTQPFGHLSCTDFDHVWNNRPESVCRSVRPWEISEFCVGVLQAQKKCHPGSGILDGVFVISVQLKRHNFRR